MFKDWLFCITEISVATKKLTVHMFPVPTDIMTYPGMQDILKKCVSITSRFHVYDDIDNDEGPLGYI